MDTINVHNMIRETDIKCPVCGAFIFCDYSVALSTSPVQYRYYCPECGEFSHNGFSNVYIQDYIKKNFAEKETTDYHAKRDYGKAKLTLVPRRILWDIAAIREYGNDKYPEGGPDNWKAVEVDRYRDATFRHLSYYLDDPHGVDKESGFPHLWHLACNIAFLCEMEDMYLSKNPEVVERLKKEFEKGDRPQGEWINKGENLWECSNCGMEIYSESERDRNEFHKWCGRCGADMKGADDDSDNI